MRGSDCQTKITAVGVIFFSLNAGLGADEYRSRHHGGAGGNVCSQVGKGGHQGTEQTWRPSKHRAGPKTSLEIPSSIIIGISQ